jgi:hypothetical protein
MAIDWRELVQGAGIAVEGDGLEVALGDERLHRVSVRELAECILLTAVVTSASVTRRIEAPVVEAWTRNRGARVANFYLDARGRLVGEARVPLAGLTGDELSFCVRKLAEECDRFEQNLTGRDVE